MADQLVSVSFIAKLAGKSERYIQKLAKAAIIPKAAHGKYYLLNTISALIAHLYHELDKAKKSPDGYEPDELLDKDQEQAKSAREDWIRKQRENAVADGELLDAEEVRQKQGQILQAISTGLETMVDYVEREAGLTPEQAEAMQRAIDKQRNAIADKLEEIGDAG